MQVVKDGVDEVVMVSEGEAAFAWYAVQIVSNQELKVKRYWEQSIEAKGFKDFVKTVLVPTKTVVEVKNGKKINSVRKFYPGYIFLQMKLYDEDGGLLQDLFSFIQHTQNVVRFIGGDHPVALKQSEIDNILGQVEALQGKKVVKVAYEVGEAVKITDGAFLGLSGIIDEIDTERNRLRVSVSIFGRFTPVDLEYWQVQRER